MSSCQCSSKISCRDKNRCPSTYKRPEGPGRGPGTPRGSLGWSRNSGGHLQYRLLRPLAPWFAMPMQVRQKRTCIVLTQEGLKCILKLQSWYCRVTYRNMCYYKKLQTKKCYKMSFFSKDIITCMLSSKTYYCSGLYGLFWILAIHS